MDTEWSKIESRRGGGGKDKIKKGISTGKRSLEVDEDGVRVKKRVVMEEYKVLLKFKPGQDMFGVSPINLSNGLKKAIGDVELAKVLKDGSLLIICKNAEQKQKALRLQAVCKKEVLEKRLLEIREE